MSRYFGSVGYVLPRETSPGVIQYDEVVEREYYGDLIRSIQKNEAGEGLNDDLNINQDISILADEYAYLHSQFIKYATMFGVKWKVKSIEVSRPRIKLSLGGVYNDQ